MKKLFQIPETEPTKTGGGAFRGITLAPQFHLQGNAARTFKLTPARNNLPVCHTNFSQIISIYF